MADESQEITLLETLDHLLDRGVVIAGEATISVGDVDLLYLGLNIVLANIDAVAFEIICIDDGSKDDTLARLLAASRSDTRIKVIELSRNFGKDLRVAQQCRAPSSGTGIYGKNQHLGILAHRGGAAG